ncbi:zz type zinc finger domain-containing protein [Moniliophthora roreri]|uniref:Putative zz type zinc finger domain-containing protein n=1 Tax=Moniliophthora roreri TaxID=221103 RepID=A0A0W0FAR8_MONRR|nr:zz type zinc finger domain-containing protein [Moniliophthora roreri]
MFTIKATYRNETRKFNFADTNAFPSFHELYLQLYRVFPISHNYYLSKLLFSPDSSKSRILLAKEVHSAEEYDRCIAQYGGRSWVNPLLKFSVYDETPHKLPNMSSASDLTSKSESQASSPPRFRTVAPSSASECSTSAYSPIPFSHIPPPPIIFSTIPSPVPPSLRSSEGTPKPLPQQAPQHVGSPTLVAPTVVAELRNDMKNLSERLEGRLDKYMSRMNDIEAKFKTLEIECDCAPQVPSSPTVTGKLEPEATTIFPPLCKYTFCVMCGSIKQGPWYDCQQCALKVCTDCNERPSKCPCKDEKGLLSLQRAHTWIKQACPSCPTAAPGTDIPVINAAPVPTPDVDVPMQSPQMRAEPDVDAPPPTSVPATESTTTAEPVMPVHFGIRCDSCQAMPIQGVRHKCLDCPDYDLCTECITSGAAERHNPFHEFFEINEPGRVVVHTVYQGNGERNAPDIRRAPVLSPPAPAPAQPVVHFASCNLCDSRIRGDRYKCLNCPDYDTCSRCFDITPEHHPQHAFVKIETQDQFIRRNIVDRAMHHATCNSCEKGVFGIRYKCMHPECPDYDLCEDCEALPIPVHPANHPLLKMRDVNTVIPTVYRVGGTRLMDSPPARTGSHSEWFRPKGELLRDLVTEDTPRELSPEIKPPSPFFFATESERSVSPPAMDYRGTTTCIPPPPPPPAPIVEYRTSPSEVRTSPRSRPSFLDRPPRPFYSESPPSPPSPPMMIPGALPPFTQLPQVPQIHQWQPSEFWRVPDSPFSRALDVDSQTSSPARLPSPPRNRPFMVRAPPSPPRLPPIAVGMKVPTPPTRPSPPTVPVPVRIPSPPPRQLPSARFSVSGRSLPSPPFWANYRVRFAATPSEPDFSYLEDSQTRREVVSPVEDVSTSRVQLPPPPPSTIDPFHTSILNPFTSQMSSYSPGFWHGGHLMDERSTTKQNDEESSFEKDLLRALEVSERLNSKRSPSPVPVPPRESPLIGELLNSPENAGTSAQTYPELFKPSLIEFLAGPNFAQSSAGSPPAPEPPVEESPLIGDLLNRPASMVDRDECCSVCSKRSLASILDGASTGKPQEAKIETFIPPLDNEEEETFIPPSSRTLNALLPEEHISPISQAESEPQHEPRLDATYIDDRSVPDGQIFPPGAEFVKSWRMMNTGNVEWPEGTELVFVGGDCLERIQKNAVTRIGKAGASESVDVWTGELKAPEKEGRYVSYYRLRDDQGVVFGDSIWLDITVKEGHHREEDERADSSTGSEEYKSLSSSSVIIMPTAAASVYTSSSIASSSLPSSSPDGDGASENGSSTSSVSLLSVPDDEDDEDWAETRESFASPPEHVEEGEEYVVLYDSESD